MFETKKKFLNLVESSLTRARNSGFLVGDYVKIVLNLNNKIIKKWYEPLADEYKEVIKSMAQDGKKIRIAELNVPAPSGAFGLVTGTDLVGQPRFATVYEEIAANLWGNVCIVPVAALRIIKLDGNNITPGHPTFQQGEITTKPVEVKIGDQKLPKENTKIPSGPVSDGRNQAKKPEKK